MQINNIKITIVGPQKVYPAYNSVLNNIKNILGDEKIIELKIKNYMGNCPFYLKFMLFLFQDFLLCSQLLSIYKKEKFNQVLFFQIYYPVTCVVMKLLSLKVLIYIGGSDVYTSYIQNKSIIGKILTYFNLLIEIICNQFADSLITLSKSMIKLLSLTNYIDKIYFVLPRINNEFYTKFTITKKYSDKSDIIGFVGNFNKNKGILNLIEAIPLIINNNKNVKFMLIGEGPLLNLAKKEVEKLNIVNYVKFTGFVNGEYLYQNYNEMKLYILPSYSEGIPSTLFEAMACGTPVLATSVGGIPELIKDQNTGFILKSNNSKFIAYKVTELLDDKTLLSTVSNNAFRYVRTNYNENSVRLNWEKIFLVLNENTRTH